MSNKNYSYKEYNDALNNRIDIHKKYSNFNLHGWIKQKFKILPNQSILDMGCGNGNFINFFLSLTNNLEIIGVDNNRDLLNELQRDLKIPNVSLIHEDFDNFKISNKKFDWIFFIYSIYYSQKPEELINKMFNLLKKSGSLVMIATGKSNAIELDKLNKNVTGMDPKPEYTERQQRIENEFYKIAIKNFKEENVSLEILNNFLNFPDANDYAHYYWSTLLWRDSIERLQSPDLNVLKNETLNKIQLLTNLKINKQVSVLVAKL